MDQPAHVDIEGANEVQGEKEGDMLIIKEYDLLTEFDGYR
jgi:hypothetical protein